MTNRYDLLITSMQDVARTVTILFCLACSILIARWSIRFIPGRARIITRNLFDLWLVAINLILFVVSQ